MNIFSDYLSISPAGVFLLLAVGWVARKAWGWLLLTIVRGFPHAHAKLVQKLREKADAEEAILNETRGRGVR